MFWKIVGGIAVFFAVVLLGGMLLAAAGVAVFGSAVGSFVEAVDLGAVQVIDASGNTETVDLNTFVSESGRVEIVGDGGDRVTFDLNVPQITVQEGGRDGDRVIIGSGSTIERINQLPQIRIDSRGLDGYNGPSVGRIIGGFFRGLINLALLIVISIGVWMVVRNNRRAVVTEKSVDAAA